MKKKKSNCNYPSILVNTGTDPRVLCCFFPNQLLRSSTVNFSSVKFLCRCIINFLSSCGKFQKENIYIYISGLYFSKKSSKLFIPKISPWRTFSFIEKNEHTFSLWILSSPFPNILGGGGPLFYDYLCQNTPNPAGLTSAYFIFPPNAPRVAIYTFML